MSRQYQALQAHLRKGFGNSGGGSVTALRGPQSPIPGAPWSTWGWAQAWLPEAVHSRPDGLQPLFSFLEKEKGRWVSGGIQLEMAGQVLLTVGLVLRDLSTAQFVNDPDDRPSGVPAYVFDSKLGFKEYNHLLDILEELKAVRVLRSGVAGTSIAPAPSQPSGSTRPKPRPAYQGIRMAGDIVNADHDELELSEELLAKTSPLMRGLAAIRQQAHPQRTRTEMWLARLHFLPTVNGWRHDPSHTRTSSTSGTPARAAGSLRMRMKARLKSWCGLVAAR